MVSFAGCCRERARSRTRRQMPTKRARTKPMDLRTRFNSYSARGPIPVFCGRSFSLQSHLVRSFGERFRSVTLQDHCSIELHRCQNRAEKRGNFCERCVHSAEVQSNHLYKISPSRIANFRRAFCNFLRSNDYESSADHTSFRLSQPAGHLCSTPFLKLVIRPGASFAIPVTLRLSAPSHNRVDMGVTRDRKNRVSTLVNGFFANGEV